MTDSLQSLSPETASVRFGFASYKGGKFELIAINIKTGEEITLEGQLRPDQTLEQIDKVLPTCVYVNGLAQQAKEPSAYWVEHPKFGMELSLDPPNEDAVQRGWVATPLFALADTSTVGNSK